MKLKSFLLMAFAASTTLAACDKSESSGPGPDKTPKSVKITLPNINPGTRAIGDAIADNTKVELKNFKVFFVKANGAVLNDDELKGGNATAQKTYYSSDDTDWAQKTAEGSVLTYHFLPYETTKVVVVGNLGDVEYSDLANKTENVPNDTGTGKDKHPTYSLYGTSTLTEGGAPDDTNHQNIYQASVTLEPRVSRFEIYGFEYKAATAPATNHYSSVAVEKIALNHFYTKYDFVTKTPKDDGKVFENPGTDVAWSWIENRTTWCDNITNLTLNGGDKKFVNGTSITDSNETGDTATGIITYGLAHVEDKANNPELLLALHGTPADGGDPEPLYLHAKFNGDANASVGAFASGKIYRVLFSFDDDNIKQPQRCVELTVSVASWDVVPVTPEF